MATDEIGALSGSLDPFLPLVGTDAELQDFWRWAYSDVLSNGVRGVLGEYLVGLALGVTDRPRVEWDAVDIRYGQWRIEVKTTSAHQAWPLAEGSKPSAPGFGIGRRRGWDAATGTVAEEASRASHCYVFCAYLGPVGDSGSNYQRRVGVLDVGRWEFYVVPTSEMNEQLGAQQSIGLARIRRTWSAVEFDGLRAAIDRAVSMV